MSELLNIEKLSVEYNSERGTAYPVKEVSLCLRDGEKMGIVGESGSGKSTLARTVMRLLPASGKITGGSIIYRGEDIGQMPENRLRMLLGSEISMIFQDPMQCLDPSFSIGYQLMETLFAHESITKSDAKKRAMDMLDMVGIPKPDEMLKRYPFQLSGGMQQRVMIAMALLLNPRLLIADEPTTALDVTMQEQILGLIKEHSEREGMAVLFITHSFGVVAEICDSVTVMYGGRAVETGSVKQIFYTPAHPYTSGLLMAAPSMDGEKNIPLKAIEGVPPDVFSAFEGCPFYDRCTVAMQKCATKTYCQKEVEEGHYSDCLLSEKEYLKGASHE